MSPVPRDPIELERRAVATEDLLNRIATSTGADGEWWNHSASADLSGRTPTEAWLAGEHAAVRRLIEIWYDRTDERAEQIRDDPAFLTMIEEHRRSVAAKADHRRTA
jgi:hypothetical protein